VKPFKGSHLSDGHRAREPLALRCTGRDLPSLTAILPDFAFSRDQLAGLRVHLSHEGDDKHT
jgi:hypothetical protein